MDIRRRSGCFVFRFQADAQGISIAERTGETQLRWSAVQAVDLQRQGPRTTVRLLLNNGSIIEPTALREVTAQLATDVQDLWRLYGPPGASAMWGRPSVGATAASTAA